RGTNLVTCTAIDGSSNSVNCTFRVIIRETAPLVIICPSNIVAAADIGQCSKSNVTYTATATSSSPVQSVLCTPPSGSTFPIGTNPVTCTASDSAGNTASCSFQVTVNDTQLPVITCPPDLLLDADAGQCSKSHVTYTAAATDNCPGVTVNCV